MKQPPESHREDEMFWVKLIAIVGVIAAILIVRNGVLPARNDIAENTTAIDSLNSQIGSTMERFQKLQDLQQHAKDQGASLKNLMRDHPEGSAIVWLPKLTVDHFSKFDLDPGRVRLNVTRPDEFIPGLDHVYEGIEIPIPNTGQKISALLTTVADLEENNPDVRVTDFIITPHPTDPTKRSVAINLEALDKRPTQAN